MPLAKRAEATFSDIAVGLGWERLSVDGQFTDEDGGLDGGEFSWVENAIVGSVAANILDTVMAGVNTKCYIANVVDSNTALGFGLDLGLLMNLGDLFTVGINAMDLVSSKIQWDSEAAYRLNSQTKVGAALRLVDGTFVLATDLDLDRQGVAAAHLGMEFRIIDELAIRAGVSLPSSLTGSTMSVGGGVMIAGLSVDAAYLFNDLLGNTLLVSAEFSLGELFGMGDADGDVVVEETDQP